MAGGFAGGLAQGISNGMQLHYQGQALARLDKADARDAEIHELRKDQYASEKEVRDRRNNTLREIAEYTTNAMGGDQPAQPQTAQSPSLVQNQNAAGFSAPPEQQTPSAAALGGGLLAPDRQAGGLAPTPQAAQQPAQPDMPPAKVLERGMVTGMYSPKMLTDIAGIFAKNGLHEEGIKYMEQAYTAQKRGVSQAAMSLMQNNPGAAIETLKQGGVNVTDMPVKVKPDDPDDHHWKLNIDGQGQKTINVKDWLQSTMDPEKFFDAEDKKRKAALEDRKQANDDQKQLNDNAKTKAEIGYLNSRSSLTDARAEGKVGGLKPSRSSEAQINTAISRRDKSFDRVSSIKNDEGKFEVDPQKRQELDSAANQYQTFLEDQIGEELDARQHHKFTDVMLSYPVGGSPEQIKQWQQKEFLPRFGGRQAAKAKAPAERSVPPSDQGLAPSAPAVPTKTGTLASLNDKAKERQGLTNEMAGIQKALKAPNLDTNQKAALAMKAQEIASRRDALK